MYVGSLCMSEAKENYTHVIKKNELGLTKESHRKNAALYFEHLWNEFKTAGTININNA